MVAGEDVPRTAAPDVNDEIRDQKRRRERTSPGLDYALAATSVLLGHLADRRTQSCRSVGMRTPLSSWRRHDQTPSSLRR